MRSLKRQFRNAFTGKDNETIDIGRVIWAIGALVFFALSVYAVVRSPAHAFDAIAYGTAFGAIMAGGGLGLGMKAKTEPDGDNQTSVRTTVEVKSNETTGDGK